MMTRPKLLDLFCGAGGAAMGYYRAGFDVVGVDVAPQNNYPFEFIQCDWREPLGYLPGLWEREGLQYAIHASPPCQHYSTMTKKWGRSDEHPDLVQPVREAIQEIGCPYVIENVRAAGLMAVVMLCGSMFGLPLRRHRYFEMTNPPLLTLSCKHDVRPVAVYGHSGGSSKRDGISFGGIDTWKDAMQIDWMTGDELAEAIPPAYTEFIGAHLLQAIEAQP